MQLTTPERFYEIWRTSKTLGEVARRARTTKLLATARASRFRREGWKMRPFKRGRTAKRAA